MDSIWNDRIKQAPRAQRQAWEELRKDRDLLERLKVTPHEMESLANCALLGTLTGKQDMLFVLRQIRGETEPSSEPNVTFDENSPDRGDATEQSTEASIRSAFRLPISFVAGELERAESFASMVRRRFVEQFALVFWLMALIGVSVWGLTAILFKWREKLAIHSEAAAQAPLLQHVSSGGVSELQHLIFFEVVFILAVTIIYYSIRRRGLRRLKVRPA